MQLGFKFLPSEFSNDHQARIIVDGHDILQGIDNSLLGIDPVEFFSQPSLRSSGELLIGRCECGCVGCGDVSVVVCRSSEKVEWLSVSPELAFVFPLPGYDVTVAAGTSDVSWESLERTAERLVSKLDYSELAKRGLLFEWASARIKKDQITLSFKKGGEQHLYEAPWDHKVPTDAVVAARQILTKLLNDSCDA